MSETNTTDNTSTASSPGADADVSQLLRAVIERLDRAEGRISEFGRDLGKVRGKLKTGASGEPAGAPAAQGQGAPGARAPGAAQTPQATGPAPDDVGAMLQLVRLASDLGPAAERHLEKERQAGATVPELLRLAEAMKVTRGAAVAQPSAPIAVPAGTAATSAARSSPSHPRTLNEYAELARKDPELKRALDADPTFDPSTLPRRR